MAELVANQLNQIGFKVSVRYLEAAAATEKKRSVKPDQQRPDLLETSVSSPTLDSSRIFDSYHVCGGRFRIGCDPEFDRRYAEAKVLTGDARDKAFQALWAYEYDKYLYLPIVRLELGPRGRGEAAMDASDRRSRAVLRDESDTPEYDRRTS